MKSLVKHFLMAIEPLDLSNTYLSVLFSLTSIRLYHHLRLSIYWRRG